MENELSDVYWQKHDEDCPDIMKPISVCVFNVFKHVNCKNDVEDDVNVKFVRKKEEWRKRSPNFAFQNKFNIERDGWNVDDVGLHRNEHCDK